MDPGIHVPLANGSLSSLHYVYLAHCAAKRGWSPGFAEVDLSATFLEAVQHVRRTRERRVRASLANVDPLSVGSKKGGSQAAGRMEKLHETSSHL